ncbi:hypothetical protein GCM10017709_24000 [Glutamicibacter nicotianae]|uniref:NIL domain-containing protein n=2 Tax=Glutamicibacter nicotianae TaxID=37929 RepID=A0ABQ0RJN6_GLUNI|nr:hypothetical protein ANI01nite_12350 [Glutamicibacter nicotianae]
MGIARALATDPDVLLCDEPTSALDPKTTDEILDLVKKLRDRLNITVLIITHEMHVVKQACDSVSLLEAGKIVEHGNIEQVITNAAGSLASTLLPLPGDAPRVEGEGSILDLLYTGDQATQPVISSISRMFNTDVNVLAGSVEQLGQQQYAHLRLQLAPDADLEAIVNHLKSGGIAVTVKGAK